MGSVARRVRNNLRARRVIAAGNAEFGITVLRWPTDRAHALRIFRYEQNRHRRRQFAGGRRPLIRQHGEIQ